MSLAYCNAIICIVIKYVKGEYSWHYIRNNNIMEKELSLKILKSESHRKRNIKLLKDTKI